MKLFRFDILVGILTLVVTGFAQHEGHTMPPAATPKKTTPKKQQPAPKKPEPHSGHQPVTQPPAQPQAEDDHTAHQASQPRVAAPMKSLEQLIRESPTNLLPPLGVTRPTGKVLRLEDLEKTAQERNPTLMQAAAEVRAAQGRRTQAGLLPNPTVGYTGEEIRGGVSRGGQHGVFIEQNIILGRKLRLSRDVAAQEITLAEIEAGEQKMRVTNGVRLAFFQTLASQELLRVDTAFVELAKQTLLTAQRLQNIGVRDATEVIQAEVALHKAELRLARQQSQHKRQWRTLTAVIGDPTLPLSHLEGKLDQLPELETDSLLASLISSSPTVKISEASIARSEAALKRAKRESIPDLTLRAGLQNNRELNDAGRPVGAQGFAEVGISLPIFNRNQGNVSASDAELERSKQELRRVQLVLQEQGAGVIRSWEDARATASLYQKEILPRAQKIYETQLRAWGQMGLSFPGVLQAQEELFEVHSEYLNSLQEAHAAGIALRGFLLTDALEGPARPGEVDIPVREINLPSARGGGSER